MSILLSRSPLLLLSLPLILAACGSAAQTPVAQYPVTNQPTTQTLSGTISSLSSDRSSMTVAGVSVKLGGSISSSALRTLSMGTTIKKNGKASTPTALSIGQNVTVTETNGTATEVDVRVELRGVIESVGTTSLVVAGQTVNVDAKTRIELSRDDDTVATTHTIADLTAGTFVEVSGQTAADGSINAGNIEAKSAEELSQDGETEDTEVHGTVSGLDTTGHTFVLKGNKVSYDPATTSGTLADGVKAEVEGTFDAKTSTLIASKVKVDGENDEHDRIAAGAAVTLEGHVNSLDTASKTFTAHGLTVDYAKATVTGTLALRADVVVEGTVDATDASLLHATTVTVNQDE